MPENNQAKNKLDKLLDQKFINLVRKDFDFIIKEDDFKKAFELSSWLSKAVNENREEIARYQEVYNLYKKIIIKCKFIALPLLDNQEIINLVRDDFASIFNIDYYDIFSKLKNKLVSITMPVDRDNLKKEIKKALLSNNEKITSDGEVETISGWLKDYNAKLGQDNVNNLERAQYFVNLKKGRKISEDDFKKLKILFDFYEELKKSSLEPEGYEESVPIVIDNKNYIFKQGKLEEIKKDEMKEISQLRKILSNKEKQEAEQNKNTGNEKIDKIKQEIEKYPKESIERKALEDELASLKEKS